MSSSYEEALNLLFIFSQSDDSDIWDDTALIKAYDKAVASFKVTWVLCGVCVHAHGLLRFVFVAYVLLCVPECPERRR